MKKLFTILIICMFSAVMVGQVFDWEYQNPRPHANTLRAVKVIDANTVLLLVRVVLCSVLLMEE
jgi:hypothetical protein